MAKLSLKAVEARIEPLGYRDSYDRRFIFELLDAYGKPKSSLTRLRTGSLNVAAEPDVEVAQKNVVYFREVPQGQALEAVEQLRTAAHVVRYTPRFVIATDFEELVALDMKTRENLVIPIRDIASHFTFFLPWAGMEKAQYVAEAHADVRAAERMGKLFDELLTANTDLIDSPTGRHSLNVFFTRLLFCFFAEDTGVFTENQFTNAVGSHTLSDGSDTRDFLTDLFHALDTPDPKDKPTHLRDFPYVNGRLFSADAAMEVPDFTAKARTLLIDLGTLMWQEINPDIFGSMFQAIVSPGTRSDLGQHYTSVPNILKTIEPLFLDELKERFDAAYDSIPQLNRLYDRIAGITIFDPACGSGNFLVIAYKELRRLEHAILDRLASLNKTQHALFTNSRINIENFYGIEIDDFAVEVAILSMWIAKHQMNAEFAEKFGISIPLIPLKETGNIVAGNAARLDWNKVCPNNGTDEIYLISNPPYVGSSMQTAEQKADFESVFRSTKFPKKLDYVALWLVKGADYISGNNSQLAFVTTNSITQGEQVALLFPEIIASGLEIGYAYQSFKWENNAKHNAGVTVVVISLRNASNSPKYIFQTDLQMRAENVNPYLTDAPTVFISSRRNPLCNCLPPMTKGSQPTDNGFLLVEPHELDRLADRSKSRWLRKLSGSREYINGIDRYCLWIEDSELEQAQDDPEIRRRLEGVRTARESSKKLATQQLASSPYRFGEVRYKPTNSIIMPSVSSERRDYIPIGYLGPDTVISNAAFAVYDAEPWLFALLTSRMHMVWVRAVGGKMKTDFRYSNTIVYNNFPVPPLSAPAKEELTELALRVLDVREYHCEYTLAELYAPEKMPENLRQAHAEVDAAVDKLYSTRAFETDEARLSTLFAMYEDAIAAEKN